MNQNRLPFNFRNPILYQLLLLIFVLQSINSQAQTNMITIVLGQNSVTVVRPRETLARLDYAGSS